MKSGMSSPKLLLSIFQVETATHHLLRRYAASASESVSDFMDCPDLGLVGTIFIFKSNRISVAYIGMNSFAIIKLIEITKNMI
jgi:hypothetical protein